MTRRNGRVLSTRSTQILSSSRMTYRLTPSLYRAFRSRMNGSATLRSSMLDRPSAPIWAIRGPSEYRWVSRLRARYFRFSSVAAMRDVVLIARSMLLAMSVSVSSSLPGSKQSSISSARSIARTGVSVTAMRSSLLQPLDSYPAVLHSGIKSHLMGIVHEYSVCQAHKATLTIPDRLYIL